MAGGVVFALFLANLHRTSQSNTMWILLLIGSQSSFLQCSHAASCRALLSRKRNVKRFAVYCCGADLLLHHLYDRELLHLARDPPRRVLQPAHQAKDPVDHVGEQPTRTCSFRHLVF